jgi:peptidoglycan lytic transglycosylase
MMRLEFFICLILALLLFGGEAFAESKSSLYHQALRDLRNKDMDAYYAEKERLRNHPLFADLEYEQVRMNMSLSNAHDVIAFIERYPESVLSKKLSDAWLALLVKHKRWEAVKEFIQHRDSINMNCLKTLADHRLGHKPLDATIVKNYWVSAEYHPQFCKLLFSDWQLQDNFDEQFVWLRFSEAMSKHEISLAESIDDYMTQDQQQLAQIWYKVHTDWQSVTKVKLADSPQAREIITHGLSRLAARRPLQAIKYWDVVKTKYKFSEEQKYKVFSTIALRLATRQNSLAEKWIAKIPLEYMDHDLLGWHIRLALIRQDWKTVLTRIGRLDDTEKQRPIWRYWKAHALTALNQPEKAKPIYEQLTQERHFYAVLASSALHKPIKLHHDTQTYQPQELVEIENSPEMVRIKSLYDSQQFYKARVEWNYATRDFNDKQKYLAAVMADKWGWHEKAILTLSTVPDQDDLLLRFPLAYKETIMEVSKRYSLSPALVYAIIRQESSFKHDAHSPAGAVGIMQLLPQTAKLYTSRLNIKIDNISDLHNIRSNITIGCAHFKDLLTELKNQPVYAIAAYNAGVNNVRRWLHQKSAETTLIWIETIPFIETRNYLKNIITYSAIYHKHLGEKYNLSDFISGI